jgi:hypothetical protein
MSCVYSVVRVGNTMEKVLLLASDVLEETNVMFSLFKDTLSAI